MDNVDVIWQRCEDVDAGNAEGIRQPKHPAQDFLSWEHGIIQYNPVQSSTAQYQNSHVTGVQCTTKVPLVVWKVQEKKGG